MEGKSLTGTDYFISTDGGNTWDSRPHPLPYNPSLSGYSNSFSFSQSGKTLFAINNVQQAGDSEKALMRFARVRLEEESLPLPAVSYNSPASAASSRETEEPSASRPAGGDTYPASASASHGGESQTGDDTHPKSGNSSAYTRLPLAAESGTDSMLPAGGEGNGPPQGRKTSWWWLAIVLAAGGAAAAYVILRRKKVNAGAADDPRQGR